MLTRGAPIPEARVEHRPIELADDGYALVANLQACHPDQYSTLVRLLPPDDDAGGDAGNGRRDFDASRLRMSMAVRCGSSAAGAVLGGVRRSGLRATRGVASPIAAAGRDDHRIAPSAGVLVRHRPEASARAAPGRYLIARAALDSAARGGAASADRSGVLGDRTLEQHVYRVPRHARQAAVRHALRIAGRSRRRRVDTTVAELGIACEACHGPAAITRAPTAIRCAATVCTSPAARDPTIVQPDAPEAAALIAGVRPVSRHLGVLRWRRGAPGQFGRAAVPARRRAGEHTLRGAADRQRRLAADEGASRRRCRLHPRFVLGRRHGSRLGTRIQRPDRVAVLQGRASRRAARTLSCFSCHTMHKPASDPRPRQRVGGRSARRRHGRQRGVPAVS